MSMMRVSLGGIDFIGAFDFQKRDVIAKEMTQQQIPYAMAKKCLPSKYKNCVEVTRFVIPKLEELGTKIFDILKKLLFRLSATSTIKHQCFRNKFMT